MEQLLKAYQAQLEENERLKAESAILQQKVEELKAKVTDFQNQDKMAKTSQYHLLKAGCSGSPFMRQNAFNPPNPV